ncbi:hypothetical protein WAX78_01835 [Bacillus sp. FJAT-53711]|uniref:Alpha-(1,6)-fucosyltransferase N- and catalytic domain-containing protein n=1 Tax=Bacillus yunxiaonensis TaxID=3127665 RepID=A0ABU8FQE7_9BACI
MPENNRFLLIKAWSCGFWSAMEHVSGQLLIAELTDRIPVVFWGADSLYASEDPLVKDAFTMYFLPVSNYSINDLTNENYTYYSSRWNRNNLHLPGQLDFSSAQDISNLFNRSENVLVSNVHISILYFTQWIKKSHPAYGLEFHDIHRYLYNKYFKLQPYLSGEIEDFYLKNMKSKHPILGVHIRGSDKIDEVPNLHQLNDLYPKEIDNYLKNNPDASIFLLTDSEKTLVKYQELYGDKIIYTDCMRTPFDNIPLHHLPYYDTKMKGVDIIKDTYLATKCDHFIGANYSNVSLAVFRLKDWSEGAIKLIQH